jgi:glycosyltransferase involved in cell wall biosynthesis
MKQNRTIIFYAPFGRNIPTECIGGAEVGCLKTLEIYHNAGIEVQQLDKPARVEGRLKYLLKMAIVPFKLIFTLCKHRHAPLHIVGFYNKIARYEYLLLSIGKFLNHKVIYEVRNGSMILSYNEGDASYKKTLEKLLTESDIVLCQGYEYVNFIREKFGIERSYYPNYIMDEYIKPNEPRCSDKIKLIYFGRVSKSKNVDVTIRVLAYLRDNGFDAELDIVGKCDAEYQQYLNSIVESLNLHDSVRMHGRKDFSEIAKLLRSAHYFLFPSEEKQEGHSNSLTEAMGCGVVPIVSRAGFNASICGDNSLIVDEIDPKAYGDKIMEIEKNNLHRFYSDKVYNRVLANFTQSNVAKSLINTVEKIL